MLGYCKTISLWKFSPLVLSKIIQCNPQNFCRKRLIFFKFRNGPRKYFSYFFRLVIEPGQFFFYWKCFRLKSSVSFFQSETDSDQFSSCKWRRICFFFSLEKRPKSYFYVGNEHESINMVGNRTRRKFCLKVFWMLVWALSITLQVYIFKEKYRVCKSR